MKLPIKIAGIVKKRLGRGKELGFPTANLDVDASAYEEGVYLGFTTVSPSTGLGAKLPSLIFIGAAETFGDTEKFIESYILDFSADLYGQKIEVEIIKKLRNNEKFASREALIEQMKQDEQAARVFSVD